MMNRTTDIRPFSIADADAVSRIIISNLLTVNIIDYGAASVNLLSQYYVPEKIIEYARNENIFVGTSGTKIIGTITLNENQIRNVFVDIEYQKMGIGKDLLNFVESFAGKEGRKRLFLYANISAVGFYQKAGYSTVEVVNERSGDLMIKLVLMEKHLNGETL